MKSSFGSKYGAGKEFRKALGKTVVYAETKLWLLVEELHTEYILAPYNGDTAERYVCDTSRAIVLGTMQDICDRVLSAAQEKLNEQLL